MGFYRRSTFSEPDFGAERAESPRVLRNARENKVFRLKKR